MAGRANFLEVLQALAQLPQPGGPSPLAPLPTPQFEPPEFMQFPTPEPPPPAPSAPIDQRIIQQFLGLAGEAPTPPPEPAPIGTLGRIALALQGFGAGVQGQGPQFVAALREERERPQREFRARQERFEERRAELGRAGLQAAQTAEDRRQERAQREADRRFELDVQKWTRQLGLKDQKEIEMFRDTLLAKRQREDDERQAERQQAGFEQQKKVQKGQRQTDLLKLGATPAQAKNIVDFEFGDAELKPGNDKVLAGIQARISRVQGGGGGSSGGSRVQSWVEFTNGDIVEADKVNFDRIPAGVQVKRMFSTIGGQPVGGGGGLTAPAIDATLGNDTTAEQRNATVQALRARARTDQERALIEERIKLAKPFTQASKPSTGITDQQKQEILKRIPEPKLNAFGQALKNLFTPKTEERTIRGKFGF